MSEFCPESELLAAWVEGRLTADELWRIENHLSVCDDCRREAALLHLHRSNPSESAPMPGALKQSVRAAIARSLDRERHAAGTRRHRSLAARRSTPGWIAAAAILALATGALLVWVNQQGQKPGDSDVVERPAKKVVPKPENNVVETPEEKTEPKPPRREWPPQLPEEPPQDRETADQPPKTDPKKTEEKKPEDNKLVEAPKDEPKQTEEAKPRETPRSFDALLLTDLRGELSIKRLGRSKERISGVVSVSKGDVLTADKESAFNVEGKCSVVLPKDSEIQMAHVAKEDSTWLSLQKGEALVDSGGNGGRKWILTDGRNTVLVDRTRGKFGASRSGDSLAVLAMSDGISCGPEGGAAQSLRAGDELLAKGREAQVRRNDGYEARRAALLDHKPAERTVFYASCDRADAKSGRYEVKEGLFQQDRPGKNENEYLVGVERQKGQHVTLQFLQKVLWSSDVVVRFRYRTNGKVVRVEIPAPNNQGFFLTELETNKNYVTTWVQVEIPLSKFGIASGDVVKLSPRDRLESIHVSIQTNETHGGKGFLGVDDIQFVDR